MQGVKNGHRDSAVPRFGARQITHDYSGVVALRDVEYEMSGGSVHGLVGENGSGKSTLIRLLTGVLSPRAGTIYLDDERFEFTSPGEAQRNGIGVVHQDYHLFPDLSVADNVYGVGKPPPRRSWLPVAVDKGDVRRRVRETFHSLGIELSPDVLVRSLGPAERKFVEIARAMLLTPRFLILDEPTASLEPQASRSVLDLLMRLRERGVGLCFVSHRLDEVLQISDRVTVLRDGRRIACEAREGLTEEKLADLILGRKHVSRRGSGSRATGEVILSLSGVAVAPDATPVAFEIQRGEIFGLTGLLGSGASRIVRMIGGAEPLLGTLQIEGRPVRINKPRDATRLGIGFVPEDRKAAGLVPEQSVAVNISLASLNKVSTAGLLSPRAIDRRGDAFRAKLDIRTPSVRAAVKSLSGGNQQKVMLAKWLASGVRVLAIEEPTHGIDIGGKDQVHVLLREFVAEGGTIVVSSTDASEVLELCDRIGIMRHGALTAVLSADELTHTNVTVQGLRTREELIESLIATGTAGETA